MLNELSIENVAVIEKAEVRFGAGLNVLTGETGAGKSILVDALQLIAGGRAGAEMIRHGAERADITATFDVRAAPPELREWLEGQAISDDELMTWRGTQHLFALYANAPRDLQRIAPAEVQARRIGHFGFFRPEFEPTLWRRASEALSAWAAGGVAQVTA